MKNVYVIIAYRWGNAENHSYTVGVCDTLEQAIAVADSHTNYRGGKYACAVEQCLLNQVTDESDAYTTEVYRTKSRMCK